MPQDKKIDIVNNAYSMMRISGITVQPSGDDVSLALRRLEDMATEFQGRNIDLSWNFEDTPDPNSRHGMPQKYVTPMAANLAFRLLADFGAEIHPTLAAQQAAGFSFLQSDSAARMVRETQYPARQAIGSGVNLRYNRYQRYYRPQQESPPDVELTASMYIGDVQDFVENYNDWVVMDEVLSEATVEADSGIVVESYELDPNTNSVKYRVRARGRSENLGDMAVILRIKVETDTGRKLTRVKYFKVVEVPDA